MAGPVLLASICCVLAATLLGARGSAQESAPSDTSRMEVAQALPTESPSPEVARKLYLLSECDADAHG